MDMSLREWLILIGAVILIGILLDGYRRMLRAKKESLEISQRMGGTYDSTPLQDDFNPELPAGRARVVKREEDIARENEAADSGEIDLRGSRDEPDFGWDDDDLVAEREQMSSARDPETNAHQEHQDTPRFPEAVIVTDETSAQAGSRVATNSGAASNGYGATVSAGGTATNAAGNASKTAVNASKTVDSAAKASGTAATGSRMSLRRNKAETLGKASGPKPPEEIIIINVLSRDEEGFNGLQLRRLAEACGLEYGELSVFNRHEHGFGQGPTQFGMANLTDPGTFDLATMDASQIPGVCFFLTLPGPDDTMKAFEYMLETAQCVVRNLHGEMKDERRSVFTQQTIEHCRQRVREFERRQQLTARV